MPILRVIAKENWRTKQGERRSVSDDEILEIIKNEAAKQESVSTDKITLIAIRDANVGRKIFLPLTSPKLRKAHELDVDYSVKQGE